MVVILVTFSWHFFVAFVVVVFLYFSAKYGKDTGVGGRVDENIDGDGGCNVDGDCITLNGDRCNQPNNSEH